MEIYHPPAHPNITHSTGSLTSRRFSLTLQLLSLILWQLQDVRLTEAQPLQHISWLKLQPEEGRQEHNGNIALRFTKGIIHVSISVINTILWSSPWTLVHTCICLQAQGKETGKLRSQRTMLTGNVTGSYTNMMHIVICSDIRDKQKKIKRKSIGGSIHTLHRHGIWYISINTIYVCHICLTRVRLW